MSVHHSCIHVLVAQQFLSKEKSPLDLHFKKIYGLKCVLLRQECRNYANGSLKVKYFRQIGEYITDMSNIQFLS